jgi:predicted small secreted protein
VTLPGLTLSPASEILIDPSDASCLCRNDLGHPGIFFPSTSWRVSMRKIFTCAALAGAILVSACNTVEGVGRDVSSAGDTVAKTADGAK